MEKLIIDVSKHQGVIDWNKVKESGISGAIIRCGYGNNDVKQDDPYFKTNVESCIKLEIPFGVYIYSYAKNDAEAKSEAEHVLRLVKPYKDKLSYPIYLDLENSGSENYAKNCANVFGNIIESNGMWCGIYANEYWWTAFLQGVNKYTKWVAKYGLNNGKMNAFPNVTGVDIWQYTSVGTVNGISGNVDMNVSYRDLPAEIRGNTKTKSIDQIAKEVLENKWGNGEERKQRLTNAGYDYKTVQTRVNQLYYAMNCTFITYIVKKGDTLSKIAHKYGVTVDSIVQLNNIKNPNVIYPGDKLYIKTK